MSRNTKLFLAVAALWCALPYLAVAWRAVRDILDVLAVDDLFCRESEFDF